MTKDEQLFRAFEQHIHKAISNYPMKTTFACDRSSAYVKQNFRRAWQLFLNSTWPSDIDRLRAQEVFNNIAFGTINSNEFYAGPRGMTSALGLELSNKRADEFLVDVTSLDALKAILFLKNIDAIPHPVRLINCEHPLDLLESDYPNTAISPTALSKEFILL